MARFCADLPPDLQRYLLSLSLDGLAAFALTSRVSCMRAAEALRTAITWKDIWSDKERKKSTRRALLAVSSCLDPGALTDALLDTQRAYQAEQHTDAADETVIEDILQCAVATCIHRHAWTPELLLRLSNPVGLTARSSWSIEDTMYSAEDELRGRCRRAGVRRMRIPMAIQVRERMLEDLALATFRLLGYDVGSCAFPSVLPPLGSTTLRSRLHPDVFDALLRNVIHARVSELSLAEAAWFVLVPFTGAAFASELDRHRAPRSFLTDLHLPVAVMVSVFERLALEERRGQGEGTEAHRCFEITCAVVLDWFSSLDATKPLTPSEQRDFTAWFTRECRRWLQDCLTMRFLGPPDEEVDDELVPDVSYYGPSHFAYGFSDHSIPIERTGCKECHGCELCDGSECAPRMISRRLVSRQLENTTADDYLAAERELRVVSFQLGLKLPGVDAQTQTDGEEGDAPYVPWHCWSMFHQEGQAELKRRHGM